MREHKQTTNKIFLSWLVGCLMMVMLSIIATTDVSAQSILQNNSNTVQGQTGQTQNSSTNTQQQTAPVQDNSGGQEVFQQKGNQPLGVVSNPNQTTPDVVAQPSNTLKTEASKPVSKNNWYWWVLATAGAALLIIGTYFLIRDPNAKAKKPKKVTYDELESVIVPEPLPARKKKKSKKKKSGRR